MTTQNHGYWEGLLDMLMHLGAWAGVAFGLVFIVIALLAFCNEEPLVGFLIFLFGVLLLAVFVYTADWLTQGSLQVA